MAPLVSESSSRLPTSANTPICTLDGTETDSVRTVRPDGNLVDLYVGGDWCIHTAGDVGLSVNR